VGYVNPGLSIELELIIKSINVSRFRFLHLMVNILFGESFKFVSSLEKENMNRRQMADYVYDDIMKKMDREIRIKMRGMGLGF
jgi:hypothetical protein